MFALIGMYFNLITAVISWGSFLLASLLAVALFLEQRRPVVRFLCVAYALSFLAIRIFFSAFYFQWMPPIALLITAICTIRANYEDRKSGKRWWNW